MRTLFRGGEILPRRWYELGLSDRYAAVHPFEVAFWVGGWRKYRWCLEWWGVEHGWFGTCEDGGYFSEGRWRRPWEPKFEFTLLPPSECKPPWDKPDRFSVSLAEQAERSRLARYTRVLGT